MTDTKDKILNSLTEKELISSLKFSNDWYWEADEKFFFSNFDGEFTKKLLYEPSELKSKSIFDIIPEEVRSSLKIEILELLVKSKSLSFSPLPRISKKNEVFYTQLYLMLRQNPAGEKTYFGFEKDITNLVVEKNEALKATKEKSLFLAKMSHEIRTPMNGIIGTAELLKTSEGLDEEQKDLLNIIDVSANNLLSIINDILDISKLEAGKIELENEAFSIYDLVKDVITMLGVRVMNNEVKLISEINPDIPATLYGDELRLKQIILNFVNNAIKFTKKGNIKIMVDRLSDTSDKIKLKVKVIDTGIGISKSGQEKLFQEFSQVDQSRHRRFGGTGLGLMISKKLTELMEGEIGVESEQDKGSTFWIEIGFLKNAETPNKNVNNVSDMDTSTQKLKILVAEDNVINQKVAMINLRQLGHEVEIAVNGQMAVDMFKNSKYDVVLMDIQMPVLDGLEATLAIREHEKENNLEKTPIVAITANALKEDKDRCFEVGMDDYITKPFKSEDLVRILSK